MRWREMPTYSVPDTFTFTVGGLPWLNQQWGAQLVSSGWTSRLGGWVGLDVARGLCAGLAACFVFLACRWRGATARVAASLVVAGWLFAAPALVQLRPQLFGSLLFALLWWIVASRGGHPDPVWWVPAIALVWVNVHGSFPLVFVVLAVAFVDDLSTDWRGIRGLVAVALLSAGATLVNPFGLSVWRYVVDLTTNPVVADLVGEWRPPSLGSATGILFVTSVVMMTLVTVVLRRSVRVADVLALVVFAMVGAVAARGAVWWALAAPVVLAG